MTRGPSLARRRRSIARLLGAALVAVLAVPGARASICKYVDADGNVVYSNVAPSKGLRKLSCEIADESSGRASGSNGKASATPSSFPRVEPETQKSRDEMRRKVLTDELSSEEKLLAEARDAYGNGAPAPERAGARAQHRGAAQGDRDDALSFAASVYARGIDRAEAGEASAASGGGDG